MTNRNRKGRKSNMYKYDTPFPKDGQLTLMYGGMPLNVSKRTNTKEKAINAKK